MLSQKHIEINIAKYKNGKTENKLTKSAVLSTAQSSLFVIKHTFHHGMISELYIFQVACHGELGFHDKQMIMNANQGLKMESEQA